MKKKLSLLGVTLLCSSVLATTPTVNAVVHAEGATDTEQPAAPADPSTPAEETPTEETPADPSTPTEETPADPSTPTEETPADPSTPTEETPADPSTPAEETPADPSTPTEETPADPSIDTVRAQLQELITKARGFLDYEKYDNSDMHYLENLIIGAQAAVDNPDTPIEELQDFYNVLNDVITLLETTNEGRVPNTEVSINVTDQTMHVGDVITTDMVASWATVSNAEDLVLDIEVIGTPIMINSLTNQLLYAGTYTIRYTLRSVDGDGNPLRAMSSGISPQMAVISKDITLTVLDAEAPVDPIPASAESLAPTTPVADPKVPTTAAPVADPEKNLPQTGEKDSSLLIAVGGMTLLAGAFIFNKKRVEDQ